MGKGTYINDNKLSMMGVPEHIVQMSLTSKGDTMSTTTTTISIAILIMKSIFYLLYILLY